MADRIPRKILLVEDDAGTARLCSEVLSLAGYHVKSASSGAEAMKMLPGEDFDLVISEAAMAGASDLDLYSSGAGRGTRRLAAFLFITGPPGLKSAFGALPVECIERPFGITDLLSRVDSLMVRSIVESMDCQP